MFVHWKRLLLAVYRLEEGQQEILGRLDRLERGLPLSHADGVTAPLTRGAAIPQSASQTAPVHNEAERNSKSLNRAFTQGGRDDEWLQSGIDNILSYQAGKKKDGE